MEPQAQMSQQPVQTGSSSGKGKCALVTVLVTLIFAGGAGGGVYYFMDQQAKSAKSSSDSQIQSLQTQINDLKTAASWKTYINSTYGFAFRYPSDWTVTEKKASYGDARQYEITLGDQGYYVTVFNIGTQTADAFVKSFYSGVEAGPSNIKDETINTYPVVKFFIQHGNTTGQTVGSTNYFFSKGSTGVDISNSMKAEDSDTTLAAIANSFTFQQ